MKKPSLRRTPAIVLALTATLVVAPNASAGTSSTCASVEDLRPELAASTVNQGNGDQSVLNPAKRTLVRVHLSKPVCAGDTDRVVMTAAALQLDPLSTVVVPSPTPALSSPVDLPPADQAPVGGTAASDPIFVVDPSTLASVPGGTAPTLTVRVRYQRSVSLGSTTIGGDYERTFSLSATWSVPAQPLRVLVVPLVDGDKGPEWSSGIEASVVAAMDTVGRELPASASVSGKLDGAGGLRYDIHPVGVDLRKMGPSGTIDMLGTGKFCDGSWTHIRTALEQVRKTYNASLMNVINGVRVDRVVGVIPSSIFASGCATRGWADYPGTAAYIVGYPSSVTPETTGSLATLELGHTLFLVDPSSPNKHVDRETGTTDIAHSGHIEAEASHHAFDLHTATAMPQSADRSVMRFTTKADWHDDVTLLEGHEWRYALACLSGTSVGGLTCANHVAVSSSAASSDGERFLLVGSTDGTAAGTVVDSYADGHGVSEQGDPASHYRLVQRDAAGAIVGDTGVPVPVRESHHDGHDHASDEPTIDRFGISVPVEAGAERFELWRGAPIGASSTLLYAVSRVDGDGSTNEAPTIGGSSSTASFGAPVNLTASDAVADGAPAISADGHLLAWVSGADLRLRRIDEDDASGASVATGIASVTWSPAAGDLRLAYATRDGEVHVATVDPRSLTLSEHRPIYIPSVPGLTLPARAPFWGPSTPDGADLAVGIDGDIWLLDADAPSALTPGCALVDADAGDLCPRLTRTPDVIESEPAWSASSIVYECATADAGGICRHGADPAVPIIAGGSQPFLAAEHLAYVHGGRVLLTRLPDVGSDVVEIAAGSGPALNTGATRIAYADGGDIHLRERETYTVTAHDDGDPASLRAFLTVGCGTVEHGLTPYRRPTATTADGRAIFEFGIEPSDLCEGGTIAVTVFDGVSSTRETLGAVGTEHEPVAEIVEPDTPLVIGEFSPITFVGGATDADGDAVDLAWSVPSLGIEAAGATPATFSAPARDAVADPTGDAGGWPVGDHEVALTATDATGLSTVVRRTLTIVADWDADGLTDAVELDTSLVNGAPCFPVGSERDPRNAYDDPDHDGLPHVADPRPCASDAALTDFEPNTLFVPSSGETVSVRVPPTVQVHGIDGSTVRISRIAGRVIPACVSPSDPSDLGCSLRASAWTIENDGTAVAKFDRQVLNRFLTENGLIGRYVPILIEGRGPAASFRGLDPSSPVTKPA